MEPAQLQLIVNVIAITGLSSLGAFCYLLKKENRRLAAGLKAKTNREEPGLPATANTVKAAPQDIRHFAAHRRTRWVKGLCSSISQDRS